MTVLARLLIVAAVFTAVLVIAGLAGRNVPTVMAGARGRTSAADKFALLLIDLNRGLAIVRHIDIPDTIRIDWAATPPQVLQRAPVDETTVFTLSIVDFARLRLAPALTHVISGDGGARDLEIALNGARGAVYDPTTGEVAMFDAGKPARPVASVEAGIAQPLYWSLDGRRLAVKDFRGSPITLLDAEGGSHELTVFRDAAPLWSFDSRRLLFSQDSFSGRNGRLRVVNALTGAIHPLVNDLPGRSAVWCDSETLGYVVVTPQGTHTVRILNLATGETVSAFDAGIADNQEVFSLTFAPRPECDWLLLSMRNPNERDSRFYRLHIPTGDLEHLGDNGRVLDVTAESVVYESVIANVALTVEWIPFETLAEPHIYGRIPAQNEGIVWFDGFQRGLFLRSGELWLLDLAAKSSFPLPLPMSLLAFQLTPDG